MMEQVQCSWDAIPGLLLIVLEHPIEGCPRSIADLQAIKLLSMIKMSMKVIK